MSKDKMKMSSMHSGARMGGAYFLTYIGAAIHFVQTSDGFWGFVLALLKAMVWPAYFIHRVFDLLHI